MSKDKRKQLNKCKVCGSTSFMVDEGGACLYTLKNGMLNKHGHSEYEILSINCDECQEEYTPSDFKEINP